LSLEDTHHARNGKATDAKDNAVAQLAHQIAKERGHITDANLNAAHDAGLDNELIAEVVSGVALNTLTNFMNNVAKTKIDFPEVKVELTA
jgi:alkylhydroperoxidase family enzyme